MTAERLATRPETRPSLDSQKPWWGLKNICTRLSNRSTPLIQAGNMYAWSTFTEALPYDNYSYTRALASNLEDFNGKSLLTLYHRPSKHIENSPVKSWFTGHDKTWKPEITLLGFTTPFKPPDKSQQAGIFYILWSDDHFHPRLYMASIKDIDFDTLLNTGQHNNGLNATHPFEISATYNNNTHETLNQKFASKIINLLFSPTKQREEVGWLSNQDLEIFQSITKSASLLAPLFI